MRKPIALLSVSNKDGIVEFASGLIELGYDIVSSGGTAKCLREAGLTVTDVAEISGLPPVLGHRVVTLVPQVHGGLLATPDQAQELAGLGYPWVDLLCVDLYPLKQEIAKASATRESVINKTDIGGPTMLRSAAKGRRIVICDPADRAKILEWIKAGKPDEKIVVDMLAAKAEGLVADYALSSARYTSDGSIDGFVGTRFRKLRYGENPWQSAEAFESSAHPLGLSSFQQIAGADPSMINLTDVMSLRRTLVQLVATLGSGECIALAVKHGNACGVGVASTPLLALSRMIDGDPLAIFGGFIMTNFTLDGELSAELRSYRMSSGKRLLDGVVAPEFGEGADAVLERKAGKCRMLVNPHLSNVTANDLPDMQYRVDEYGGFIRQRGQAFVLNGSDPRMEKTGELSPDQVRDLLIAHAIGSTSRSNTITLVKNGMLIGNGVGQQARVRAAKVALMIAEEGGHDVHGAVAYSDSFFPEPDGPTVLAKAGVKAIFASSGSVKDDIVRQACRELGVTLWQMKDADCRGFFGH